MRVWIYKTSYISNKLNCFYMDFIKNLYNQYYVANRNINYLN
jgi:hypothetical protein